MVSLLFMKNRIIGFIVFVLIFVSCSGGVVSDEKVKVGVILPMTGKGALYGESAREGIELSAMQYKEEGKDIELIFEDDEFDIKKTVSAYKKLVEVDEVDVIIGPVGSSHSLAIAPLADKDEVVVITPMAGASSVTLGHPYVYRTMIKKDNQMVSLIKWMKEQDFEKIVAVTAQNDSPLDAFEIFKEGMGEVDNVLVSQEEKDFRTALAEIKKLEADAVFMNLFLGQFANFIRQFKEMGFEQSLVASIVFDNQNEIDLSKEYVEELVYVAQTEPVEWFKVLHNKRLNKDPGIAAANGYDALLVVMEAMKLSEDLREGIKKLGIVNGAMGEYRFDEHGDIDLLSPLKRIKNGVVESM